MSIPTLPKRKIGGTEVTALGYGAMAYDRSASAEGQTKFLDEVYSRGCTFWDTADRYLNSEQAIGDWFAKTGKRGDIFLATKFGFTVGTPERVINGTKEYMLQQISESLKKLQTEYVDLYYLHRPDVLVPIEETVTAMAELVKEGKVRHLGLSEVSGATLRRAHAIHPIAAVQVEYSPFTLDIEDPAIGLLAAARELGVAVIAYSPLGRGLITGQYRSPDDFPENDFRRYVPRYSAQNFPNILHLADGLKEVGERRGATAGQAALAWLLAQGPEVIPIPGTRTLKYLEENLGALNVTLTAEDVAEVREIAKKADAAIGGERYPPVYAETLFAETPEWKK